MSSAARAVGDGSGALAGGAGTYMVQMFCGFAPHRPELRPLVLRLAETATVGDAVAATLQRAREPDEAAAGLPSDDPSEYLVCPALGDGNVDPNDARPLQATTVLRASGLQFPYMLALMFAPRSAPDGAAGDGAPVVVGPTAGSTAGDLRATLAGLEKEQAARRAAEVAKRREANVAAIEARRAQRDKLHFHSCESYELRRRDEATAVAAERQRREQEREAAELEDRMRSELRQRQKEAEEQAEVEAYRKKMQAALDAENARIAEARQRLEAHESAVRAQREAEKAARERELEANKGRRMADALDGIIGRLDRAVVHSHAAETGKIASEHDARVAAAERQKELHVVHTLEHTRHAKRAAERSNRTKVSAIEREAQRLAELTLSEERARREDEERRKFGEWQASRAEDLRAAEAGFELSYRTIGTASAAPSPGRTY